MGSEAWRLRLEGALRDTPPDTPITLPPDKAPPGYLLAAQQAFREEVEAVTRDLRQALEAGALRATGFCRDGMPVPIPPAPPPPTYSVDALRAWYRLRAAIWPPSDIPPTERDDIDAARAYFRPDVSREAVRRCRETLAPASWRRPGPRRRRKPRE